MIENYYDSRFELGHFEMNELGIASPVTMLTLLEETAADHCLFAGHGLYELESQKIGWVLISGFLQMDRYPRYKEKIVIRTWISSYTSIKGFRENIIYDESNNILGRGKSIWVFFDIEKRRPTRIFEDIKTKWSSCSVESIDKDISRRLRELRILIGQSSSRLTDTIRIFTDI